MNLTLERSQFSPLASKTMPESSAPVTYLGLVSFLLTQTIQNPTSVKEASLLKHFQNGRSMCCTMVAQGFNPSTREAEADELLSLKLA